MARFLLAFVLLGALNLCAATEYRVTLAVNADDAGKLESLTSRELRKLSDVLLVDSDEDYEITITCVLLSNSTLYACSATFTYPEDVGPQLRIFASRSRPPFGRLSFGNGKARKFSSMHW